MTSGSGRDPNLPHGEVLASALRLVATAMAEPVMAIPLLAIVYGAAGFDDRRRGVHDRAAGTIVVLD